MLLVMRIIQKIRSTVVLRDSPYRVAYLKGICLILFLTAISFSFYKDIFTVWFIGDDIAAIVSSTASIKEIFIENRYSNIFYTPLAVLSIKLDFWLFGLNPIPYHIHNLIILILTAFMFYKIMRLHTSPIISFVAATLTLFSLPSLIMTTWIILRQYLYPTLLSFTVVYIFVKYKPNFENNKLITISLLVLTELSFLFKEQFMTLPFVLLVLASGNIRKRILDTYPFFILLILHFLLRIYMLKGLGGYIGMTINLKTYVINAFKSLFLASKIVYGYELPLLIIIISLVTSSLRKSLGVLLIWLLSLGIQFLTMASYPDIFSLRYWFVPSLLIFTIFSLGAESIKNTFLKAVYMLLFISLFALNTFNKSEGIKSSLTDESLFYESISHAMIDKKYSDSLILLLEDLATERSPYIKGIDIIYSEKIGMRTYPTFIPADFIFFYPQFMTTNYNFYEMKKNVISYISTNVKEKLGGIQDNFLPSIPVLELTTKPIEGQVIKIKCDTLPNRIAFYVIVKRVDKNNNEKLFYDKIFLPYAEEIKVRSLTKLKHAEIVPKEMVFFDGNKRWQVKNKQLDPFPSEALTAFSCITPDNKITLPSDFLYLKK